MAINLVTAGISLFVFVLYLLILFLLIGIKRRIAKEVGVAFVYLIIAIFFLVLRRLQQIFFEVQIVKAIPYFSDITTLIFSIFFFLAFLRFYRAIKKAGGAKKSSGNSISNYRRKLSGV